MHEKKWAEEALNFDAVVGAMPGFRSREGQRKMAAQIAKTLSEAQLEKSMTTLQNPAGRLPWFRLVRALESRWPTASQPYAWRCRVARVC